MESKNTKQTTMLKIRGEIEQHGKQLSKVIETYLDDCIKRIEDMEIDEYDDFYDLNISNENHTRVDRNYSISNEIHSKIEKYRAIKNMSRNQFINKVMERGLEVNPDKITKELISKVNLRKSIMKKDRKKKPSFIIKLNKNNDDKFKRIYTIKMEECGEEIYIDKSIIMECIIEIILSKFDNKFYSLR